MVCAHLAFSAIGSGSQISVENEREEDKAGPYVITSRDAATGLKDAQIRMFLWEHWHNRWRGRLIEKRYSKEGVPATTSYTIAPDEKGIWSVLVVTHWPVTRGSTPEHNYAEFRVFSIRRIEPRPDASSAPVFISDEQRLSGKSYWLVFYDEKGKEINGS
jgi:hypothetical protein